MTTATSKLSWPWSGLSASDPSHVCAFNFVGGTSKLVATTIACTLARLTRMVGQSGLRPQAMITRVVCIDRYTIGRHCLLLDEAHDMLLAERIAEARDKSFFGMGFTTDESPPSQPRFAGLRFQITFVYIPFFAPIATWETEAFAQAPPLRTERHLLDIVHCPGKDGATVMRALDKQLSRIQCSRHDLVSGTGDGGGENEGSGGVHSLIEAESSGYIRRRCLGHLAWRVADAGIAEMGPSHKDMPKLSSYLRDGVTWRRLQALATQPPASGGLGIMTETSREFAAIFLKAPVPIIENRPECDANFLAWLLPRETVLRPLIVKDTQDRDLGADAQTAARCFAGWTATVVRCINFELLKRSLLLFYWVNGKQRISGNTSFDKLIERATDLIVDLSISKEFLERLQMLRDDLVPLNLEYETWVEVVVRWIAPNRQVGSDFLLEAMEHHGKVARRMTTHLSLTCSNILRFSWLLGGMLSTDTMEARCCARLAHDHLLRVPEGHRTPLESTIVLDGPLMTQLGQFSEMHPPCLLWRNNAKFADLFKYVAVRFCSNPDHVLHCESVHAKWQWLTSTKRSLKFKLLNSILKLQEHITQYGGLAEEDIIVHVCCVHVCCVHVCCVHVCCVHVCTTIDVCTVVVSVSTTVHTSLQCWCEACMLQTTSCNYYNVSDLM